MNILDIIKNAIQITGHHPFLFIGSGISKRYLNTEKWDELLKLFCTEFSGNDFQYNVYEIEIDTKDYYGLQPAIASLLEKDYNRAVLTDELYKNFRLNHKQDLLNNVSALKIAISEHLSNPVLPDNDPEVELLKKLAKRSISGIITTNYDTLLETLFPNFDTYIGQEELLFSNITGIGEIYKGLGVDYLIEGGQTMNPSTEDMLNAIRRVPARNIFILPNNYNIIMAAKQAKQLTKDKEIFVIPTKTIPQGITAIINFVPDSSMEENAENMTESIKSVKTGQITYAVRDTMIDNIEIHKDDIIGLGDKGMLADGTDINDVAFETVCKMMSEDSELIGIYYGQEIDEARAKELCDRLSEEFPSVDVEVNAGNQPVYYYFLSVE